MVDNIRNRVSRVIAGGGRPGQPDADRHRANHRQDGRAWGGPYRRCSIRSAGACLQSGRPRS